MSHSSTDSVAAQFRDYTEAAWNRGEFDSLDELFAEDVVVHDVAAGEEFDGREALKEWIRGVRQGFPDFEVEMSEMAFVSDDDTVMSEWTVRGTHKGRLPGMDVEPTNRPVEFSGMTVYELEDEQVTEARWYYDNLAFLAQLGVVPEDLLA